MIKHCRVCGAEYDSCFSCEKKNSWRILTDTADHYYILGVLMEYQSGHDAKKAHSALKKRGVDPSETDGYLPSVQKLMTEIYSLAQKSSRMKKVSAKSGEVKTEEQVDNEADGIKSN